MVPEIEPFPWKVPCTCEQSDVPVVKNSIVILSTTHCVSTAELEPTQSIQKMTTRLVDAHICVLTTGIIDSRDLFTWICYAPNAFRTHMHMCPLICIWGLAKTHLCMCALKHTHMQMCFGQSSTAYEFRHHKPIICIWNSQESPNTYGHLS
jgi:hypothetical protein